MMESNQSSEGILAQLLEDDGGKPSNDEKMPSKKYFIAPRGVDRRRSKERRTFEVNKMWEIHHEIVRRLVLGQTNRQIAEALGVSEQMISYTRNSKVVKDKLEIMIAARDADIIDLAKDIREKAPKALKLLEKVIDGDKELDASVPLRVKTAENWMNRAGYVAPHRVEGAMVHLTADEIKKIKEEALNDKRSSGEIIEAQAKVISNQKEIIEVQKEGKGE